jgi:tetratricopeptide (TPR) repeat protein
VATRHYEASRQAAAEIGSRYGEALGMLGTAVTLAAQGELSRAEPIYARMSLGFRLFAPQHNQAFFRYFRATLALATGDLDDAAGGFGEALSLAERFGERLQAERARVGLAQVALERGKPAEAEAQARTALGAFRDLSLPDDAALAAAVQARALVASGRAAEAEAALGPAMARAEVSEGIFVRYGVARARGQVLVETGKPDQALALVGPLVEDATTRGYVAEALELRLVRAAALVRSRQRPAARAERDALIAEAKRLGFKALERRAEALSP